MENIDPSVYKKADKGLLRLIEKARVGALSEEEQRIYEASLKMLEDEEPTYEEGLKEGREEGIGIGREEGANEKAIQIAMDMKKDGIDFSTISKWTNLSVDVIEKL